VRGNRPGLIEPTGPPFQDAVFSNSSTRAYGLTDIPLTYSPALASALGVRDENDWGSDGVEQGGAGGLDGRLLVGC
jgi:hypothetical protein